MLLMPYSPGIMIGATNNRRTISARINSPMIVQVLRFLDCLTLLSWHSWSSRTQRVLGLLESRDSESTGIAPVPGFLEFQIVRVLDCSSSGCLGAAVVEIPGLLDSWYGSSSGIVGLLGVMESQHSWSSEILGFRNCWSVGFLEFWTG
jgi:hypothetical protein